MFGKTLLQKEIASETCFNFSAFTMKDPLKISEKIYKFLIQEYSKSEKLTIPEDLARLQDCDAICGKYVMFLNQINENSSLNKNYGTVPILLPSLELLEYTHSYSNIRLLFNSINRIFYSQKDCSPLLRPSMNRVREYIQPILLFLSIIGPELTTIIEQAKSAAIERKQLQDYSKISVNLKHLEEVLSKKLHSALIQSVSISLEKPEVISTLLNESNNTYHKLVETIREAAGTQASVYQTMGEILLLKILNDLANRQNEEAILSVLLGIIRLYLVDGENDWKVPSAVEKYFKDTDWQAKVIFSLLEELLQIKEADPFNLIEDCVTFLCSYWRSGEWSDIADQGRNKFLEYLLSEINSKLVSVSDALVKLWVKNAKYDLTNLESILESELFHPLSTLVVRDWIAFLEKLYVSLLQKDSYPNALFQEADAQIVEWFYSLLRGQDFLTVLLPISLFRGIQQRLLKMIHPLSPAAALFQPLEILKKIKEFCDWIDSEIFEKRDINAIEELVLLNYLYVLFDFLKDLKLDSDGKIMDSFKRSPELAQFMDYKWQSEKGSYFIKNVVFRLTFQHFRDSVNGSIEVKQLPGESLSRYFKTLDSLNVLTLQDLYFLFELATRSFSFMVELKKFSDSIKKWVIKSWTTDSNCFTNQHPSLPAGYIMKQYLDELRWNETHPEAPEYAKNFASMLIETSNSIAEWLKATIEEYYNAMEDKDQSEYHLRKLENKLYRVSYLVSYWLESNRALHRLKNPYSELGQTEFHLRIINPMLESFLLVPNPLWDKKTFSKVLKEYDSIAEFGKDMTITISRTLIMLGKVFDRNADVKNPDYPQKIARIGHRIVSSADNPKIAMAQFVLLFLDNLKLIKQSTKLCPTAFQSTTQTEDLSDDLSEALWNILKVLITATVAESQSSSSGIVISVYKKYADNQWQRFLERVSAICTVNDASSLEKTIVKFTLTWTKTCKAMKMPEEVNEYLLLLMFYSALLSNRAGNVVNSDSLELWLKAIPVKESFIAFDFLRKMIQVSDSEIAASSGQELIAFTKTLFASYTPNFIARLGSDILLQTSEIEKELCLVIQEWSETARKRNAEEWRNKLLGNILQSCLVKLVIKYHQTMYKVNEFLAELLPVLKGPKDLDQKFSVEFPFKTDAVANSHYKATKFFLEAVAAAGFSSYLQSIGKVQKNWPVTDLFADLLTGSKKRFVESVKSILNEKPVQYSQEMEQVLISLMNDFETISVVAEHKYFEFIIFHLAPQATKEFSALTMEEVADFLIISTKLMINSETSENRAVLRKIFQVIYPKLIHCLRQVIICYHNDRTGLIEGSQQLLKTLDGQMEELIPLTCSLFSIKPELYQEMETTNAFYELIITFAAQTESTKLLFQTEVMKFLFAGGFIGQNKYMYAAILILQNSFPVSQYIEAVVKFSVFHSDGGRIESDKPYKSFGAKLFHTILSKINGCDDLKYLHENLVKSGKFIQFKGETNLHTVHTPQETEFFNVIMEFSSHPSAVYIDHFIKSIVAGLTALGVGDSTNSSEGSLPNDTEKKGLFALRGIARLIVEYPFLGPYLFFKDISSLFEKKDNPAVTIAGNSTITEMINTKILGKFNKKSEVPFGAYLIEVLVVAAHPDVYEFLAVLLAVPVPLLFKDESEEKGYLSFNTFIRNCLEQRVLTGLTKLNIALRLYKKMPTQFAECIDISREICLAHFFPLMIWTDTFPLAEKSNLTKQIWEQLIKAEYSIMGLSSKDMDYSLNWSRGTLENAILPRVICSVPAWLGEWIVIYDQTWKQIKDAIAEGGKIEALELKINLEYRSLRGSQIKFAASNYLVFMDLPIIYQSIMESAQFPLKLDNFSVNVYNQFNEKLSDTWDRIPMKFNTEQVTQIWTRMKALNSEWLRQTSFSNPIDEVLLDYIGGCEKKPKSCKVNCCDKFISQLMFLGSHS